MTVVYISKLYEKLLLTTTIILYRGNEKFCATMDRSSIPILLPALSSSSPHILSSGSHHRSYITIVDHRSIVRDKFTSYRLYLSAPRLVCQ